MAPTIMVPMMMAKIGFVKAAYSRLMMVEGGGECE